MAPIGKAAPETETKTSGTHWWLPVAAAVYLVSIAAAGAPFRGDAQFYVADALAVRAGVASTGKLWEFGHLLWRPLTYGLSPIFLKFAPDGTWGPNLRVLYGLVWIDRLAGLAAVILMADLLRRVTRRPAGLLAAILTMIWGAAFLGYAQAGGPYIPALALSVLGLWWAVAGPGRGAAKAVATGLSLAMAAAIWFPFVTIFPAVACANLSFGADRHERRRYCWTLLTLLSSGAILIAILAAGARLAGCGSPRDLADWILSSSHGWRQNRTILRAVSGCSRLFVDLGPAGVSLKRFLFKDPYNPVSVAQLVQGVLWRIALFWVFIFMIVAGAARSALGRRLLGLASIAVLPALFFAVGLFEPSSPERFLPILPVLLLALAAAWETEPGQARSTRIAAIVFAALLPVMNGPTMLAGAVAEQGWAKARLEEFRRYAGPGDLLMTPVLTDPLQSFCTAAPFDPVNLPTPISMDPIVTVAMADTENWRQSFAERVLAAWRKGADAWITKSALADYPPASTYWVEGDDAAVRWRELPAFLRQFENDRQTPDSDGFRRIRRSSSNEAALRKAIPQQPWPDAAAVRREAGVTAPQ